MTKDAQKLDNNNKVLFLCLDILQLVHLNTLKRLHEANCRKVQGLNKVIKTLLESVSCAV